MYPTRFNLHSIPRGTAAAAVLAASLTVATATAAGAATGRASSAAPTGPLTAAQLQAALPTGTDIPGYTFLPAEDSSAMMTVPDTVTTGGADCQKFLDATEGLTTTYGTVGEASRTMHQASGLQMIVVSVLTFRTPDAATTALTDGRAGLAGCTTLTGTSGGSPIAGTIGPIPQLATATDRFGYAAYLTAGGVAVLMAAEEVQVGSTIVEVALIGSQTQDTTTLHAMGTTLSDTIDAVTAKMGTTSGTT